MDAKENVEASGWREPQDIEEDGNLTIEYGTNGIIRIHTNDEDDSGRVGVIYKVGEEDVDEIQDASG